MFGASVGGSLFLNAKKKMWCASRSPLWFNKRMPVVASLSCASSSSHITATSASPLHEAAASIPGLSPSIPLSLSLSLPRGCSPPDSAESYFDWGIDNVLTARILNSFVLLCSGSEWLGAGHILCLFNTFPWSTLQMTNEMTIIWNWI